MSAWALEHLALASCAAGVLFAGALILRWLARDDVLLRHRVLVLFLPASLLVLPFQLAASYLMPGSVRGFMAPMRRSLPALTWPGDLALEEGLPEWDELPLTENAFRSAPASNTAPRRTREAVALARFAATRMPDLVVVLYLAGAVVALLLGVARVARTLRMLRHGRDVSDPAIAKAWDDVLREFAANGFGRARRARLVEGDAVAAPSCWGCRRGVVLLPAGLCSGLDPGQLRCILRHELFHLQRRDPLVVVGQLALAVGFWFHPLVWWYLLVLARDRELSCDALVVRATRAPRTYALALVEFCERFRSAAAARAEPVVGFGAGLSLERRLQMLGRASQCVSARLRRAILAGALGSILGLALVQALWAATLGPAAAGEPEEPAAQPAAQAAPVPIQVLKKDGEVVTQAEAQAPKAGREPAAVLARLRAQLKAPVAWITDQETIVSAEQAQRDGTVLYATVFQLSLPEGSRLRAEFAGKEVTIHSDASTVRLTVRGGHVRLVDEGGVARATARPAEADRALEVEAAWMRDEIALSVRAGPGRGDARVRVDLNVTTGIPLDEKQPPHGAVRWKLFPGDDAAKKPVSFKMRWTYNLQELERSANRNPQTGSVSLVGPQGTSSLLAGTTTQGTGNWLSGTTTLRGTSSWLSGTTTLQGTGSGPFSTTTKQGLQSNLQRGGKLSGTTTLRGTNSLLSGPTTLQGIGSGPFSTTTKQELKSSLQPGAKAPGFEALVASGELAGQKLDYLERTKDKPMLLIGVRRITRPGQALLTLCDNYGAHRQHDGELQTVLVWLTEDVDLAVDYSKLVEEKYGIKGTSLVPAGGKTGPPAYRFNPQVELTILVLDKAHTVTANFALAAPQPADFRRVREAIDKLLGAAKTEFRP